jgi:hypothetical protein
MLSPALEALAITDLQRDTIKLVKFGNHHKAIEFAWNLYKTKKDSKHDFVHYYVNQYELCINFAKKLAGVDDPCFANFYKRMTRGYVLFLEEEIEAKLSVEGQAFKERFLAIVASRMEIMLNRFLAERALSPIKELSTHEK